MEAIQAVNTPATIPATTPADITTIKTANGELYVQGDKIIGRMEIMGNITSYYRGDKLHRDGNLPAWIRRNDTGVVISEGYYRDGNHHRDGDLPAWIRRNDAGIVIYEGYYRDGKLHRDGDLPAWIARNATGAVIEEIYYLDGVKIDLQTNAKINSVATNYQEEAAAAKAEANALRAELDELKKKIAALAQ